MQRVTSMIGGSRRLLYNDLFTGVICRRSRLSYSITHRRAISSLESHRHHSHTTRCNAGVLILPSFSAQVATKTNCNGSPTATRRLFWSSTDEIAEAVENDDNTSTTSLLPISPITPSNISAISLLSSSTIESLNSLPECKFVLDLLNGTNDDDVSTSSEASNESGSSIVNITKIKEAYQNLSRANDILSSMPNLQISIKLLEIDLLIICGKFSEALSKLNQYELYLTKQQQTNQVVDGVKEGEYDTQQYHHGHSERDISKRQYDSIEEANETIARMRTKGKDPNNTLIPYYNPSLKKYLIGNDINSGTSNTMSSNTLLQIQVIKSKLFVNLGQYEYTLSEYENMLENMEREVERQMHRALALQQQQQQQQQEKNNNDASNQQKEMEMPTDTLPVIHGASALTGVGVTKLLLHLREHTTSSTTTTNNNSNTSEIEDIIESIQTATEILLESRTDAINSTLHTTLAVDLGIAASISLTNLGITHVLLLPNNKTKKRAIKHWKKGIQTLDLILQNAVTSTIIIPRHKFQLMESIRARLYCNIAYILLGLDNNIDIEDGNKKLDQVSDDKTLKEASDAAKKALDIYDELLNGSKMTRGDADAGEDSDAQDVDTDKDDIEEDIKEDTTTTSEEWEKILKDQASLPEEEHDPNKKPKAIPISTLWKSYHKAESARALGLVAQCYASAGAAVTAEGLFQSALDASSSYPIGQSLRSKDTNGRGVSLSSPNLGLIARDVRLWYANLCNNWDKRKGDADRLRMEAKKIEDEGVLKDYVRLDGNGEKRSVSGLESSLWIFSPGDFER